MPTWNDYKRHVQEVNPETAKVKEVKEYAAIISDMLKRGGFVPASDHKSKKE